MNEGKAIPGPQSTNSAGTMPMPKALIVIAWLLASGAGWAQLLGSSQDRAPSKTIRITGDPSIAPLLNRWENQFRVLHPDVSFENRLTGPASAMAGLYTNVADLAFAGHELLTSESMGFEWVFHYKALPIQVTSGSLDGSSFAPEFVVNAANPLSRLTLAQANSLLSCNPQAVPKWGDLGLTGEWANMPVHLYSYDPESEVGIFIRHKILKNSYKWSCEMKVFDDHHTGKAGTDDVSKQIVEAVGTDRWGIGLANSRYAEGDVKGISLADSDSDPGVMPSAESLVSRQYPLVRPFLVYVNRVPGKSADGSVSAFLRFVLSKEGQQQVVSSGTYLPLSDPVAREQLRKLE